MFRVAEIQEKLMPLIGWEQNYDTSDIMISDELTVSETGLYFQYAHPLLTLQNVSCIAPDFKNANFPIYSDGAFYKKGNLVSDIDGQLYRALKDNKAVPFNDTGKWVSVNPFSEWLKSKTQASIIKAVSNVINNKLIKGTQKALLENKTLFDGTGRIIDVIKNRNNLVGFELVPIRSKGVTTKINKIGLQFTEPGKYTIYIMHSSSYEPVYTLDFEKTKKNSLEWFDTKDVYLPYKSINTDAGGSWYICYLQSELPNGCQAIRKERDWSKGPCKECSRREYETWHAISKYMEVHPFFLNEELVDKHDINMWDIKNNQYVYDTNFGINLELSVECDITDFIIEQRTLFTDVIMKQLAVDMLREFAYNTNVRTNRRSINASRVDILYEIDGDSASIKKSGLSYQLEQAYNAVEIITKGLDRVCMPCANNGIKYRTI